ncbi:hypothetical protein BSLG_009964 [Batrachochytrium salamandrivorans]|nr:hypothetical protein BSLG_009964 [Batrachochytrium salamandrivorans]
MQEGLGFISSGDGTLDPHKDLPVTISTAHNLKTVVDEDLLYPEYASDGEDYFEQSSLTVPIPSYNKGFQLLLKMGWKQGMGLGVNGLGRVDPVPIGSKGDTMGLGKAEQMRLLHSSSTSRPKLSNSEKIASETVEAKMEREIKSQKSDLIKEEIRIAQSSFYCALCDKQYTKICDYDTHLSSYDHHHRKRFSEMKELSKRGGLLGQRKSNREGKEQAREQKELARMQEAMESRILKNNECSSVMHSTERKGSDTPLNSLPGPLQDTNESTSASLDVRKPIAFGFGSKKQTGGSIKFSLNKK